MSGSRRRVPDPSGLPFSRPTDPARMIGVSPDDPSPGDRVALLVPGSARYVDVVLSLLVRGIIPIPLDPRLTDAERAGILADLEPTLVVTEEDELDPLALGWEPGQVPLARPMHVTSGTTGAPKGVYSGVLDV